MNIKKKFFQKPKKKELNLLQIDALKKYQTNLQLSGFSKGSLCLDVVNSLLVSILTEFIKELVIKKTGNENVINIHITNSFIYIDESVVHTVPQNSCMGHAIQINLCDNTKVLDVRRCAHDIVESAKPNENIEESIERLLVELHKNNLINQDVIYDSRGKNSGKRY